MDNKAQKDSSNFEFSKTYLPNDYQDLVQKLKMINNTISLLEKDLFEKEI